MPLTAAAVGADYLPRDVELSTRELMSFAAGLGATGPELMDDARPEGIVGFPTYCAALEFNAFRESSARGRNPAGATAEETRRGVHAGQDSFFHAPLRPGDRLRTCGKIVGARPSSAGAIFTLRVETTALPAGRPVVTSWVTQLFRGLPLDGEAMIEAPPPRPTPPPDGEPVAWTEVTLDRAWPHIYAECAGIWNPIHSERRVALAAGLPDIILQGTAVWGLAAREILRRHDEPATGLARLGGRFSAMALPGDTLRIGLFEAVGRVVPFDVRNQHGAAVMRDGFAVLRA